MRFDVRLPATLKHAFDLHPGVMTWYDSGLGELGGQARINAFVGEDVEVRLELKGVGRLVYFEMVVSRVGGTTRGGIGDFEFRITRIAEEDRSALEGWIANASSGRGQHMQVASSLPVPPSIPAPPVVPAPVALPPSAPSRVVFVSTLAAPQQADRTVRSDWDRGMLSVRWSSAAAFCAEWDKHLQFAGLLVPLEGDAPSFGTACDVSFFLVDDSVLTVPASVVGRTGGQLALQVSFTRVERDRMARLAAQSRRVPLQASGAR